MKITITPGMGKFSNSNYDLPQRGGEQEVGETWGCPGKVKAGFLGRGKLQSQQVAATMTYLSEVESKVLAELRSSMSRDQEEAPPDQPI